MRKSQPALVLVSRSTAHQTPIRCAQFLRTVGTDPVIYAALQTVGFGPDDRKEGWDLLWKATNLIPETAAPVEPSAAIDATTQLDTWRSLHVNVARAALRRLHPAQASFVFDTTSPNATLAITVGQFLDRLDALESSPKRKSTRTADHAALAILIRRGVTEHERKAARRLITVIENSAPPAQPMIDVRLSEAHADAVAELHRWLIDWSECARSAIKRRDQLFRLGIGKRPKRTPAPPPVAATPYPIVTPAPTAVAELTAPPMRMLPAAQLNGHSRT